MSCETRRHTGLRRAFAARAPGGIDRVRVRSAHPVGSCDSRYLVHTPDIQLTMRTGAVPVGPATRAPRSESPAPGHQAPECVPRSSGAGPTVRFARDSPHADRRAQRASMPRATGRLSRCWNPICSRLHDGASVSWYALCGTCWTFEPNSCRCRKCRIISSPFAPPMCELFTRMPGHARRFRRAHARHVYSWFTGVSRGPAPRSFAAGA